MDESKCNLIHAALGITTEGGEISDAIKKHVIYGQDLDIVNIMEEIGDLMWYVAILVRWLDLDLDELLTDNINKLRKRYPEGFTEEHAAARLDKEEPQS
jgi:NTP pyrophosphatase (non-canonical NTP hydrolase)